MSSNCATIQVQMGQMNHMYEIVCNIQGSYHPCLEKYHVNNNQFFKIVDEISSRIKGRMEYWKDKQFQLDETKRLSLLFWKRANIGCNIVTSILVFISILCLIIAITVAIISYLSMSVDRHVPQWMTAPLVLLSIGTFILCICCNSSWIGGSILLYLMNIKWHPNNAKDIQIEIQNIFKEETDRMYSQYPGIHIQLPFSNSTQASRYTVLQHEEETQHFLYQDNSSTILSNVNHSEYSISLY